MMDKKSFSKKLRKRIKKSGRSLLHALAPVLARQSLIGDQPVYNKNILPWIADLEKNSQAIRHELDGILESKIRLPLFHEISPEQKHISKGDNWKTFVFYILGEPYLPNCQRCPETALQLARIPKLKNAMFSILEPHYHIPPHQGPTKGVIRVHLGLKIPSDKKQCGIRVENHILTWEEGQCIVFDDFFEHEAWNDTDEQRIVLFLDVERPMRLTGRLLNRVLFAIGRRSVFIRDAYKKLHRWEYKQTN